MAPSCPVALIVIAVDCEVPCFAQVADYLSCCVHVDVRITGVCRFNVVISFDFFKAGHVGISVQVRNGIDAVVTME